MHFTRQKIEKPSDLQVVQGKLSRYSFVNGYRGSRRYKLFLEGEKNPFQIPADFLRGFDKPNFESMVHTGDTLKLSYNTRLWVFSVADANRSYLSTDSTIEIYNKSPIQIGLVMLSFGAAMLLGRYFFKKSKL